MKFLKGFVLVVFVLLAIIVLIVSCSDTEEEPIAETEEVEEVESVELPSYLVSLTEDVSFSNVKRFSWQVVISEPVTPEQLMLISERVIEEAKNKENFNAVTIFYYDYEEYIGHGYVLGRAVYAPGGDWGKADTVNTGDYDKMSFKFDMRNKDWSKQLTPEEVQVWVLWNEFFDSLMTDESIPSDEEVDELVAMELNMEPDVVKSIIWKQLDWTFLDE